MITYNISSSPHSRSRMNTWSLHLVQHTFQFRNPCIVRVLYITCSSVILLTCASCRCCQTKVAPSPSEKPRYCMIVVVLPVPGPPCGWAISTLDLYNSLLLHFSNSTCFFLNLDLILRSIMLILLGNGYSNSSKAFLLYSAQAVLLAVIQYLSLISLQK